MKDKMLEAAAWAVEQARSRGVEAESYVLHSKDLTIEVVDGEVETLKEADEVGLGIRVLNGDRIGFAFTTDLGQKAVNDALDQAITAARYSSRDEYNILPENPGNYPEVDTLDPAIQETDLEVKIEMARDVERQARARDARIKVVERAGYEDSTYSVAVVNSRGIKVSKTGAYCGIFIFLAAEQDGAVETGFAVAASRKFADLNPQKVGFEAADNAVRSLGARTISSRSVPCVLEPYVMTNFLGVLADSFGADAVQKGKSALAGRIGEVIAGPGVTLVDDGTLDRGVASFPFDGEGWPAQRTVLIEKGVMQGLLYDTYTARKDKTRSTGNGMRGSFRGLPGVGTTNLYLEPGSSTPEALRSDIENGLLITEVMGMHTANPISGDFSVGASGIMIEKGQLTYPVRGVTIAGNLFDFLKGIEGTGSDLRFFGSTGAPSVRVKSLSIAGE